MEIDFQCQQDDKHYIPIVDCKGCGERTPLSTKGPYRKEGYPDIYISFCPNCERVPVDDSEIIGYASEADMFAAGWAIEEVETEDNPDGCSPTI